MPGPKVYDKADLRWDKKNWTNVFPNDAPADDLRKPLEGLLQEMEGL